MIKLENVRFSYKDGEFINIPSLTLNDGEFTVIAGENGSGKTTLLRLIMGELIPFTGSISVDNEDIKKVKKTDLAKRLSYSPQGRRVPDMTALETVLLGRYPYNKGSLKIPAQDKAIAEKALKEAGAWELSERRVTTLSYGERQKIYLAMQISQGAKNRIFDEPTNYMDVSSRFEMMASLKGMAKEGMCITAVLHDISLAMSYADRIILVKDGEVASF